MSFDQQKETALKRMLEHDHSKKGSVDENIKDLLELINNYPEFYTTSSCGGRLLIFEKQEGAKKNQLNWLYCSHDYDKINPEEIFNTIKNAKHDVWFAVEAMIVHIAAKSVKSASHLLLQAQEAGLKRGGAISMENRIVLEIKGVDEFSTIIIKDGKQVVSEDYILLLIKEATKKLERNNLRIRQFKTNFLRSFK